MKTITKYILALLLVVSFGITPAYATVVYEYKVSGETSVGHVDYKASLSIENDLLTVILQNSSFLESEEPTAQVASLLTSFYWDIVDVDGNRPTLTLEMASGNVYSLDSSYEPVFISGGSDYNPDNDEVEGNIWVDGSNPNDLEGQYGGWDFVQYDNPGLDPYYGFGIGTAGNANFTNAFNGSLVDGFDYGIYAGSIPIKQNFVDENLVEGEAIFVFSGLDEFTEDDIFDTALFGAGTAPDSTFEGEKTTAVPIPSTALILFSGLAGIVGVRRKLRK